MDRTQCAHVGDHDDVMEQKQETDCEPNKRIYVAALDYDRQAKEYRSKVFTWGFLFSWAVDRWRLHRYRFQGYSMIHSHTHLRVPFVDRPLFDITIMIDLCTAIQ